MKSLAFLLLSSMAFAADVEIKLSRPEVTLVAQVAVDGEITIANYPRNWVSSLKVHSPKPDVKFFKDLSDKTCRDVELYAKQAADAFTPGLAKARALEITRKINPFLVTLDVGSQLRSSELIAKVREKIDLPTLSLKNPLQIRDLKLTFKLGEHAISRHLGIEDVERTWSESFTAAIKSHSMASAEIPTMDVLCDLATGNAELTLDITVEELNKKQTRQLLSLEDARGLSEALKREQKAFDPNHLGNNRIAATLVLADTLRPRPSRDDIFLIVEKLTHANGLPKELSDLQLTNVMTVPLPQTADIVESVVKLEAK